MKKLNANLFYLKAYQLVGFLMPILTKLLL